MGIFRRISDIVSANLNELIDRFEDPEAMLKQVVREMEAALQQSMQSAARLVAGEKLLAKQREREDAAAARWQREAERAVRRGDDDAARNALMRRREQQKVLAALDDELASTREASLRLRRQIDAMQVRLREARRKESLLSARRQAAEIRSRSAAACSVSRINQSAFGRFEVLSDRVERTEAEMEAYVELAGGAAGDSLCEGFPTAADDPDSVEAELQELKQRLNQPERESWDSP